MDYSVLGALVSVRQRALHAGGDLMQAVNGNGRPLAPGRLAGGETLAGKT
jgi:hypothetical protein